MDGDFERKLSLYTRKPISEQFLTSENAHISKQFLNSEVVEKDFDENKTWLLFSVY